MTRTATFRLVGPLFFVIFAAVAHGVLSPRSELYGPVLVHGDRHGDSVALTFDDGPNEPYTSQVLDILKARGVRATFFLVGINARNYPETVRRIVAEGHEIANHSFTHPYLIREGGESMLWQIDETQRTLEEISGVRPRWFRPPHGFRDPRLFPKTRRLSLDVCEWSNMPRDWTRPGTRVIVDRVLRDLQPGDIVLLHDGAGTVHGGDRSQTVEALPRILDALAARGLRPVTVTQIATGIDRSGYRQNFLNDREPADTRDCD